MVFNLRCQDGHRFEGWFRSSDAYVTQRANAQVRCPVCESAEIEKLLTAPRLNLGASAKPDESEAEQVKTTTTSGSSNDGKANSEPSKTPELRPSPPYGTPTSQWDGTPAQQAMLDNAVRALRRKIMSETEDVGRKFADVARAMTSGEEEQRGIRGTVTPKEAEALADEGIATMAVPAGFLEDEKLH